MQTLQGKVAVATGASRGVGRGIALVLGEEGATVYVTGRSTRGGPTTKNLPETIDETAELVTAQGGVGIPIRCDHTVDDQVGALFQRTRDEAFGGRVETGGGFVEDHESGVLRRTSLQAEAPS
jgi:NAD(P)-dependent dehydrogenase (short-subunit alcohol dehydrogenase family)